MAIKKEEIKELLTVLGVEFSQEENSEDLEKKLIEAVKIGVKITPERESELLQGLKSITDENEEFCKKIEELSQKLLLAENEKELFKKEVGKAVMAMPQMPQYSFVALLNNRTGFAHDSDLQKLINVCKADVNIKHYELFLADYLGDIQNVDTQTVYKSLVCKVFELGQNV